jgi:hypothetical protein
MPWLATDVPAIVPPVFVLGFVWLSLAIGRRALVVLGAQRQGGLAERALLAAALGSGALQFVPFFLGAVGALGTLSLRVALGVIALAFVRDLHAVSLAAWRAIRQRPRLSPWVVAWAMALVPVVVVAALLALAPTTDPDGLAYHLTVPKRWLQSGRLDYLPTYSYSNAPMGVEMLFSIAMAFAGDIAAKGVHCALGAMAAFALYLAGKRLLDARAGVAVATLYLVGPFGVATMLGCAYLEGAVTFAMATASLAWVMWWQTRDAGCLRCAGALAGVAVSFKLTAALFPVALLAATWLAAADPAWGVGQLRERTRRGLAQVATLVPFVVAPVLPWMVRSALVTGNPVFPLFARWIPSRDLSPDVSTQFERYNRYMLWGNRLGRDWSIERRSLLVLLACAVVVLFGAFVVLRLHSWLARGLTAVAGFVVLGTLMAAGFYGRYWIPAAAVLMLPLAIALRSVNPRPVVRGLVVAGTLAVSLLQGRRALAEQGVRFTELVRVDAGLDDRRAYLVRHLPIYPLYEDVNRELPPDSRVMLSCSCTGFYIDRPTFCSEMPQESLRFATWGEFASDLRNLGVTHVVAGSGLGSGGPAPPPDRASVGMLVRDAQISVVRRLLTGYARLEMTTSDQALYDVRGLGEVAGSLPASPSTSR